MFERLQSSVEVRHVILIETYKRHDVFGASIGVSCRVHHVKISNVLKTLLKVKYYSRKTYRLIIVDMCLTE